MFCLVRVGIMIFFSKVSFLKIFGVWNMWEILIWLILCGFMLVSEMLLNIMVLVFGIRWLIR